MTDDAQLLRQYVDTRSEVAFNQLVERHLGLVYHSVARQLGEDSHLAPDVTQGVFLLLAERARVLCNHPSLAGWLHTTAHFKVSAARRGERRRRIREEAAFAMRAVLTDSPAEAAWEQIRPILDDVVLELPKKDREAVLLRFFEGQAFAEIGLRLQLTEKGAYTRVDRALGRLRERLGRRGITSSAAALGAVLSSHAGLAAPSGMGAIVAHAVAASPGPASAWLAALQLMSTTKTSLGILAAAIVLTGGFTVHEAMAYRRASAALVTTNAQNTSLEAQLRLAQREQTRLASLPPPATARKSPSPLNPTQQARADGETFLRNHPEFKSILFAQGRAQLKQDYSRLFEMLGLTPAQIEQFVRIKAARTRRILGTMLVPVGDLGDIPSGQQSRNEMRTLLGPSGMRVLDNYERTAPARLLATDVAETVYFTPTPLSAGQATQLEQIVSGVMSNPDLVSQRDPGPSQTLPHAAWEAVLTQAQGVLTQAQLAAVEDEEAIAMQAQTEASNVHEAVVSKPEANP
jgi:RNA polymerase sigma factor (sigma-70 family)